MQDTRVQSLVWDYPLEEGVQPTPVFLPRESHWTKSLVGQVHGVAKSWTGLSD